MDEIKAESAEEQLFDEAWMEPIGLTGGLGGFSGNVGGGMGRDLVHMAMMLGAGWGRQGRN